MSISDKLVLLNSTKSAIAQAIEDKGVTVGDIPFSEYPEKIAEISGGSGGWVRPDDWLELPEVTPVDEIFVGLFAVTDDFNNRVALTAEGDFTVDWGDGVVENFAAGIKAEHQFDYDTLPVDTLSSRGYKQVIITVTAQSGQMLTELDLSQSPTAYGGEISRISQWLDMTISLPNATGLVLNYGELAINHGMLEQVKLVSIGAITDTSLLFLFCYGLRSVLVQDATNVTNMFYMFYACFQLESVTIYNTSNVVSMEGLFMECENLTDINLMDTSSVTNMADMFSNCTSLRGIPLLDTSNVTTAKGMFTSCRALMSIPQLDTSNVTTTESMFSNCTSLRGIPLLDTSNVTTAKGMFEYCQALMSIPQLDFSALTDASSMFAGCIALISLPALNMSAVTITSKMLLDNFSLSRSKVTGLSAGITYEGCNLPAEALDEIFTNLAVVTGKSIIIYGNPGADTCDRTIAEAKGWTVI